MLDRGMASCVLALAAAALLALPAEATASGCDGAGYRSGFSVHGHGYRHGVSYHGGYSSGYHSNRFWGPRYCYTPYRYHYQSSYGPYPYRYDYPRYSSGSTYVRRPYPSYSSTAPVEVYESGVPSNDAARASAWELLSRGQREQALAAFSRWARGAPEAGEPKLGYALASAMLGDDATAIFAMRRALEFDPHALHYFAGDDALRERLRKLVDRYAYQSTHRELGTDPLFMVSALYYLLGEYPLAREALAPALRSGEPDATTLALRDLVDEALEETRRAADGGE